MVIVPRSTNLPLSLLKAESWSVEYLGDAYDDARMVDSLWYARRIVSRVFQPFLLQGRVIPLFKNPPLRLPAAS
jgi:hypothetical protein